MGSLVLTKKPEMHNELDGAILEDANLAEQLVRSKSMRRQAIQRMLKHMQAFDERAKLINRGKEEAVEK